MEKNYVPFSSEINSHFDKLRSIIELKLIHKESGNFGVFLVGDYAVVNNQLQIQLQCGQVLIPYYYVEPGGEFCVTIEYSKSNGPLLSAIFGSVFGNSLQNCVTHKLEFVLMRADSK